MYDCSECLLLYLRDHRALSRSLDVEFMYGISRKVVAHGLIAAGLNAHGLIANSLNANDLLANGLAINTINFILVLFVVSAISWTTWARASSNRIAGSVDFSSMSK